MSNHVFCLCGEKGNQDAQSQVSDVGSIPIARSITHDDSIVLTPLHQLNTATKLGFLVPCWSQLMNWSQCASARSWTQIMDAAIIGRCLGVDHLNPSSLNFDLENR